MYAFQFQDGSWRIDSLTNSRSPRPQPRTEAYDLYEASYLDRRDANAPIQRIRALVGVRVAFKDGSVLRVAARADRREAFRRHAISFGDSK
jgi:hypothetical protein